jgi:hypothetical protein
MINFRQNLKQDTELINAYLKHTGSGYFPEQEILKGKLLLIEKAI